MGAIKIKTTVREASNGGTMSGGERVAAARRRAGRNAESLASWHSAAPIAWVPLPSPSNSAP